MVKTKILLCHCNRLLLAESSDFICYTFRKTNNVISHNWICILKKYCNFSMLIFSLKIESKYSYWHKEIKVSLLSKIFIEKLFFQEQISFFRKMKYPWQIQITKITNAKTIKNIYSRDKKLQRMIIRFVNSYWFLWPFDHNLAL